MSAAFPEGVIINLLCRLPVKTLLRFKCVSKQFCSLIEDPYFIKLHLNHSSQTNPNLRIIAFCKPDNICWVDLDSSLVKPIEFDYPDGDVVGSCNGLLAISEPYGQGLALLNPSTRSYKILPRYYNYNPKPFFLDERGLLGLGYDVASDDYKLVRIAKVKKTETYAVETILYSLKTNSWRRIEVPVPYGFRGSKDGVFVGGALHWVAGKDNIIAFDVREEKFIHVPRPGSREGGFMTLSVLGGCLCCLYHYSGFVAVYWRSVDVWVMKEYGVEGSWTKLFSMKAAFDFFNVLTYSMCGKRVLVDEDCGELCWYNLEERRKESFDLCWYSLEERKEEESFGFHGETSRIWGQVTCVLESLVSLDSS